MATSDETRSAALRVFRRAFFLKLNREKENQMDEASIDLQNKIESSANRSLPAKRYVRQIKPSEITSISFQLTKLPTETTTVTVTATCRSLLISGPAGEIKALGQLPSDAMLIEATPALRKQHQIPDDHTCLLVAVAPTENETLRFKLSGNCQVKQLD
jgi:hypothetical protein